MIGHLIFRLVLWFLLTANFSAANIIIGISIALLLPRNSTSPERLSDLFRTMVKIAIAIPQAYIEAVQLMLHPHSQEEIVMEQVQSRRFQERERLATPGQIFLNIFLITFTPKTIVVKHREDGLYEIHRVLPKKKSC